MSNMDDFNFNNSFYDSDRHSQQAQGQPLSGITDFGGASNGQPPERDGFRQDREWRKMKASMKKTMAAMMAVCCIASVSLGAAGGYLAGSMTQNGSSSQSSVSQSGDSGSSSDHLYTSNLSTGSQSGNLSEVIEKVRSSVVAINVESTASSGAGYFFGGEQTVQSAGSGVILSEDGYIVTNNHVIEDANSITVYLQDGSSYPAKLVGTDDEGDIALLKIEASGLNYATLGDSDSLKVGDAAVAIGNPLGELAGSVSQGIISALDREITLNGETMNLLQTDAAINPGNSGGALFNANGEVIGIVVAKSGGDNVEGLGFAIPVNDVKEIVDQLSTYGYVTGRPTMGASFVDISDQMTAAMYRVDRLGVYVLSTEENSAAAQAGLLPGDCVLSVNGQEVSAASDIQKIVSGSQVGDTLTLDVIRYSSGQKEQVQVILAEEAPESANQTVSARLS